jgi:hypothetical protein
MKPFPNQYFSSFLQNFNINYLELTLMIKIVTIIMESINYYPFFAIFHYYYILCFTFN